MGKHNKVHVLAAEEENKESKYSGLPSIDEHRQQQAFNPDIAIDEDALKQNERNQKAMKRSDKLEPLKVGKSFAAFAFP